MLFFNHKVSLDTLAKWVYRFPYQNVSKKTSDTKIRFLKLRQDTLSIKKQNIHFEIVGLNSYIIEQKHNFIPILMLCVLVVDAVTS